MKKIPVVVTLEKHGTHTTVHVEAFSMIEKAEAHFLVLCAENFANYDGSTQTWRFTVDNKTVYIQWINVK